MGAKSEKTIFERMCVEWLTFRFAWPKDTIMYLTPETNVKRNIAKCTKVKNTECIFCPHLAYGWISLWTLLTNPLVSTAFYCMYHESVLLHVPWERLIVFQNGTLCIEVLLYNYEAHCELHLMHWLFKSALCCLHYSCARYLISFFVVDTNTEFPQSYIL